MISYHYHLDAKNRGKVKAEELSDFFSKGSLRPKTLTVKLGTGAEPSIKLTKANNFRRLSNFLQKNNINKKSIVWVSITESVKMSNKIEGIVSSVLENKATFKSAVDDLTESLDYKVGEKVVVSHGIYLGIRGKIKSVLEGGYYEIESENKDLGNVQVPGFALRAWEGNV